MVIQNPSSASHATKPPKERRERRLEAERLWISGVSRGVIVAQLSAKFGVSVRIIDQDLALVRRRWERDRDKTIDAYRKRVVARMERNARECHEKGDLHGERQATYQLGRLLGMGNQVTVDVAGQLEHRHLLQLPDPAEYVRRFLAALQEIGGPSVLDVRVADARSCR